jgi:ABC-type phosphate transport system substrate-binding protein
MKKILSLLVLIVLVGLSNTFAQSFKVIVNNDNAVTSLTTKEVSDFLLKKKTKWSSGIAAAPVDLSSSSQVRAAFSQQIHGKNTAAIRSYWQQAAFAGTGTAPAEKQTDTEVVEFVKKNPGAIGYVSSSANTSGVKIVSIQ